MKWRPRSPSKRMLHVKVRPLKLQGITINEDYDEEEDDTKILALEIIWKGSKPRLASFYISSSSRHKRNRSSERVLGNRKPIEWNEEEFENVCDFSVLSIDSWDVLFNVLHGKNCGGNSKLAVAGKVSLDLAKLVPVTECSDVERKLPVALNVDGVVVEASLFILVSFVEVRGPTDMTEVPKTQPSQSRKMGSSK
ncbi:uncharacterized protein LOC120177610 [Hibiscus syriacus]|uniref:uncharacterized protein LOC120177610 n=1 Tax=Hibiscus syriacus TaxID=106335 RepID=UPI00192461D6|nr:uncharacterized protein LOC120177610 [Hibiscus syriacus]